MPYMNNKAADQPAHPSSLISAFVVHCLDSIILVVSISESSSLYLASEAEQAGLSQPLSQTPKTGFLATWLIYKHPRDRVSFMPGNLLSQNKNYFNRPTPENANFETFTVLAFSLLSQLIAKSSKS